MRFFSLCLAVVVLAAGVACTREGATGVSVDSNFKPFLPSAVLGLAQVDLQALKKTQFYERHQTALQAQGFDAMAERVGIDARRDVAKVLLVWDGKKPLALAAGQFQAETVDAKLANLGAQRSSYRNYTLLGNPEDAGREAVAFISDHLAVAGPVSAVHQALDDRANGSGAIPDALRNQLSKLHKEDQIWAVSSGPLLANVPLRSDVESALSNISNFIMQARAGLAVDSGIRLDAEITCISNEGAQRVRDALRGGIGLARLATNNNNFDMLRLWDAFKVSQNGAVVDIMADISPALADKLVANAPQIRERAREELRQR